MKAVAGPSCYGSGAGPVMFPKRSAMADNLSGYCILIVEDNFFVADEMRIILEGQGAAVIGPAPTAARALVLLEQDSQPDAALLDINLRDSASYPVADALRARGVPFMFLSAYEPWDVPELYRDVAFCGKPARPEDVTKALLTIIAPA